MNRLGPIVKGALLIALTAAIAWGQEPQGVSMSPPNPVFLSDAQPAHAKLLEAVCPGHVVVGADVACDGGCPVFTGHSPEPFSWQLVSESAAISSRLTATMLFVDDGLRTPLRKFRGYDSTHQQAGWVDHALVQSWR